MGHVQMEQGDLREALKTYQTAATLTPGCLLRLQRCGSLGFYAGQRPEALRMLERAMAQGLRSKLFDMLSLVLIGLMRFDSKDFKGFKYAHDSLAAALERAPGSIRLQRFELVFRSLTFLLERRVGQALVLAREFTEHSHSGDFDLEAASLLTALWIRLSNQEVELEEMMPLFGRLGMRHCTTKASTEILVAMAEVHQAAADQFRDCHLKIFNIAETAMRHSMRGSAKVAVELLIQQGEATRNAKLIDMAGLVLKRHAAKIDAADALAAQIEALHGRYVKPMTGAPSKAREAGGVALRTAAATTTTTATAAA
jgi:tetratricopeptide (TPR) repeat protein